MSQVSADPQAERSASKRLIALPSFVAKYFGVKTLTSQRAYRLAFGVVVVFVLLILSLVPFSSHLVKGSVFFVFMAILLELLEVYILKFPPVRIADAIYIAAALTFPVSIVLGIVALGSLGRAIYYREFNEFRFLLLVRRMIVFGLSAFFFKLALLQNNFQGIPGTSIQEQTRELAKQMELFLAWLAGYSFVSFVLANLETMVMRRSFVIIPNWYTLIQVFLSNLLILTPFMFIMYTLYQIRPYPFPLGLFLFVPPLLLIYRSVRNYANSLGTAKTTLEIIADAVDKKFEFTKEHSMTVSRLAGAIALAMGYGDEDVELVKEAGLIHNIGGIGISSQIFDKRGTLTDDELRTMKKHPEIGANMVSKLSVFAQEAKIIKCHHENFDGSGYPNGLKARRIPPGARIVSVVDAFVAMISERPHRPPLSYAEAAEEIKKGSGTKFDPKVVKTLLHVIKEGKNHVGHGQISVQSS